VFANELTQEVLIREFPYAFTEKKYPGVPEIHINTIAMDAFRVGDIEVLPIMVWHLKMPVLGFRFGNFTYITDANKIDKPEKEKIAGSEVLVLNTLRKEKHISHFSLSEAILLAEELKIPQTFFTHMSHQMGRHSEINRELPGGVCLSYDGLVINI
jgi:phosphoribosyl 1,2-cyclic phosphate phosphodiesterase